MIRTRKLPPTLLTAGVLLFLHAGTACAQTAERMAKPHPDLPDEFQQIIPRGRIAAIDAPTFVGAKEAEIPDEAWVLGVEIGGEARAYSLNLLNRHEIVNDRVGDRPIAAVW